jgi:hypothetical protein
MDKMGKYAEPLATALAAGCSIGEAIARAGVSSTHGYRRARTPEVRRRVAELRASAASATVGLLTAASSQAVRVLSEIMGNAESKDSDRIAAARAVLSMIGPMSELGELRSRLDQLEAQRQGLGVVG